MRETESGEAFGEAITYATQENQHKRETVTEKCVNKENNQGKCVQGIAHRYPKHGFLSIH